MAIFGAYSRVVSYREGHIYFLKKNAQKNIDSRSIDHIFVEFEGLFGGLGKFVALDE